MTEFQHHGTWEFLYNATQTFTKASSLRLATHLLAWRNSVELVAEAYFSHLELIFEILYFFESGLLHPDLIKPKTLDEVFTNGHKNNISNEFPFSVKNLYNGALPKIIQISMAYFEEKIIFEIQYP